MLILVGIVRRAATVATVIGPGRTARVSTRRAAADVKDRYEHGAGVIELHLEEVSDIDALAGRTIEVDANVGQVIILVPTSIDATIDAEVTGGGDIEETARRRGVRQQGQAKKSSVDDEDPDVAIDLLRFGQVGRYWECRTTRSTFPPGQQIIEPTGAAMSQRHATDVISLVFGVIFAGFTVVWCSRSPTPSTRGRPGWSGRSCSR